MFKNPQTLTPQQIKYCADLIKSMHDLTELTNLCKSDETMAKFCGVKSDMSDEMLARECGEQWRVIKNKES